MGNLIGVLIGMYFLEKKRDKVFFYSVNFLGGDN